MALTLLKWTLLTTLALLAALLVLVSLRWGPTHWAVALLLAAVWVALLGLLVLARARFYSRRMFSAATLGFLLLSVTTVAVSQASASTPPIVDAQGTPIPGSIASLEKVNLNGSQQWISIRGKSIDKPVLLFLAGGPGGSQLATARHALGGLEDHFVVVNWDQPGAGKSFDAVARAILTPERYVEDGHALVLYLKQRFNVYPQLWDVDFRTQATHLDVPVYFLIGRHDINAPVALTQEYEQVLQAPHKEIVWFEHSGHTPWTREPDRFVEVLVNQVLKQTQSPW